MVQIQIQPTPAQRTPSSPVPPHVYRSLPIRIFFSRLRYLCLFIFLLRFRFTLSSCMPSPAWPASEGTLFLQTAPARAACCWPTSP